MKDPFRLVLLQQRCAFVIEAFRALERALDNAHEDPQGRRDCLLLALESTEGAWRNINAEIVEMMKRAEKPGPNKHIGESLESYLEERGLKRNGKWKAGR